MLKTIALLTFSSYASAQTPQLSIGDFCPEIKTSHVLNFPKPEFRLSDYRNSLVILDFWATWCVPCIATFPKIDSLQKKYKDKVQFMLVTTQDRETVDYFFKKYEKAKKIELPSITDDTMLIKLFPNTYIPHYIWINKQGKVIAITGREELTSANIDQYLKDKSLALPVKKDAPDAVAKGKSLFYISGNNGFTASLGNNEVLYSSIFSRYKDGLAARQSFTKEGITCVNNSIQALYRLAAGYKNMKQLIVMNRSIWDVKNPSLKDLNETVLEKLPTSNEKLKWMNEYGYCYDLQIPELKSDPERKFEIMLKDLNSYFEARYGIIGSLENRKVKCLILTRRNKNDNLLLSKGGMAQIKSAGEYSLSMYNKPFSTFVENLRLYLQTERPLVDETNFTENVDLELDCDFYNVASINSELKRYGLELIEAERNIDMIVVKDTDNTRSKDNAKR